MSLITSRLHKGCGGEIEREQVVGERRESDGFFSGTGKKYTKYLIRCTKCNEFDTEEVQVGEYDYRNFM